MKNILFIVLLFIYDVVGHAQCVSGNCKNGTGNYFNPQDSSRYQGQFKNGLKHGFGEYYYSDGSVYKGQWKKGLRHGKGLLIFENGDTYDGEWKDDNRTGKGKYVWTDGTICEGYCVDGFLQGQGKINWTSGAFYNGEWLNNTIEGIGEMHYDDGTIERGMFKADTLFEGNTIYKENDLSYTAFSGDTNATLIIDAAAIIDDDTKKIISDLLWGEYRKTSNTFMVFTIPNLNGQTIEEYAHQTFNRLKLGKANKNNGVLLLVAVNERRMRIEVGYGLEGVLPDLLTQRIQQQDIIPSFKNGNMSLGILKGVKAVLSVLQDPKNAQAYAKNTSQPKPKTNAFILFIFYLIALIVCVITAYKGRCGRFLVFLLVMLWFSFLISKEDRYGMGFLNSFLLHISCLLFFYFLIRSIKAGKIKRSVEKSFIQQLFYNNASIYKVSSSGSSGSSSSSSSQSSSSSRSNSSSWSGGGSSGGGGSSSSW
ncbi:MAG: TPM domain-containing protein [Bacteroidia bacterium]|nr:TPM domain-containing protein [Bacteroidia bacterium]